MRHKKKLVKWAALWSQYNTLDGRREHFILYDWQNRARGLLLFDTKKACKQWISERYGYLARRGDLRNEPHCWRVPQAVQVNIEIGEIIDRKFAPTIWSPRGLPKNTRQRRTARWFVYRRERKNRGDEGTAQKRVGRGR